MARDLPALPFVTVQKRGRAPQGGGRSASNNGVKREEGTGTFPNSDEIPGSEENVKRD